MTVKTIKDIDRFLELPFEHKICFTMIPCREKDVISIQNPYFRKLYGDNEWQFAIGTVMKSFTESKQYDFVKL